ncbi:MFS transporter [uncultured Methanolobus sp.]|uniref:MFS transporter n=1 Tax=uncultured Methanolobus sp. TaxID=218300 RepID=UPI0029C627F9|nr:MFS transporter [uncultured Methanolobus sp.]
MDKNRFLIYSTVFLIMALSNSVIPVLPEISSTGQTSHSSFITTLLFSGYFIGALLTMIPFGLMADIYEHIRFIVLAIALTFFTGIVLTFTENVYLLIAGRFIEGIACGAFFPAAYAILSGFREKNRYIGEFNFLLNAGLAAGVLTSGFLAEWSIRGAIILFTIMAALILSIGIHALFAKNEAKETIVRIAIPAPNIRKIINKTFDSKFLRTWTTAFLIFGITGVMLAFYPEYSKDTLSKPQLGIAIAILYVSSMATNVIVGRMNLDFKRMVFAGILLATAGVVIAIKSPFLGFALIGIGSGTGMIGLPIAVSHMPLEKGLAMGIFNTYTYAGLAFMPIIAGLFVNLGYQAVFILSAFFMVLSLFLKDGVKSEE